MKRVLKFRVWVFLTKEFVDFDIYEGASLGIAGGVSYPQQFTGLLDKNGKEIYEGDLVDFTWLSGPGADENELLKDKKNLEDILKSIEEDGTTEHNNAIKLREENAKLNLHITALHKIIEGGKQSIDNLKKDVEGQQQLKDSLHRVNEKYIQKVTEQADRIILLENAIERWHSRSKEWEKMDEEIQSSVSELTKEVLSLRHLKTENVELIEKLEKEGKSYGMTFNEAKTQIIQNDYKKCAEERDEYKHQLNAVNKALIRWEKWEEVCDYINNHDELKAHGFIVHKQCLRFLKERDELKAEVEKLKKDETQKHPMYPLH